MVRQSRTSLTAPQHLNKESQASWWQQQGSAMVQGPPSLTIETTEAQGEARKLHQSGKHRLSEVQGQAWAYLQCSLGRGWSSNSALKPRHRDSPIRFPAAPFPAPRSVLTAGPCQGWPQVQAAKCPRQGQSL